MNTQKTFDASKVVDYFTLISELVDFYYPEGKPAIAEYIGFSPKTIYNIMYGEPVGVYTKKKLSAFMVEKFHYQIEDVKGAKDRIVLHKLDTEEIKAQQAVILNDYVLLVQDENRNLKNEMGRLREELDRLKQHKRKTQSLFV